MGALYTHRLKVVRPPCKACRGKYRSALILLLLYLWASSCQNSCYHLTDYCQLPLLPLYHSLLFLGNHRVTRAPIWLLPALKFILLSRTDSSGIPPQFLSVYLPALLIAGWLRLSLRLPLPSPTGYSVTPLQNYPSRQPELLAG